ncbi:YraN family protein [Halonatronum saccharophilum]|uniref:YraN family protein n=1 Tax=Halonatronum saccharophilum TaxID=150060 RepID=UPI000485610A|nr:YraN family protein [Halonatronum saccharophilum]
MNKRELGRRGEQRAKDYLISKGYRIVEENFWCRWGEIDIIAWDRGCLAFVEVKMTRGRGFMSPSEQIDYRKKENLTRVAKYYITQKGIEVDTRFDLVAISKTSFGEEIELFKNIVIY